jgi:hypothetical protein
MNVPQIKVFKCDRTRKVISLENINENVEMQDNCMHYFKGLTCRENKFKHMQIEIKL